MYCCAHKTATLTPIQHTVWRGGQKSLVFVHAQGMKTVHEGKWGV